MKSVIRSPEALREYLEEIQVTLGPDFDKPYSVSCVPFKQPKTSQQNKMFHALIAELADHLGYSPRELKEAIKAEYGYTDTLEVGGQIMNRPRSVADYNITQISQVIDRVIQLGAECGYQFESDKGEIHERR